MDLLGNLREEARNPVEADREGAKGARSRETQAVLLAWMSTSQTQCEEMVLVTAENSSRLRRFVRVGNWPPA
jgi:hypothetical protein